MGRSGHRAALLNPAIAQRLRQQRTVQRADLPSPQRREMLELLRSMRRGDRPAAEEVLRRIADENDEFRDELSHGVVTIWRRELGSYDLAELHAHYARLLDVDNVSVYKAWQDGLDKVSENAAALKLRTSARTAKRLTVDDLIQPVMRELFTPFAGLVANAAIQDPRWLAKGWLKEIGLEMKAPSPEPEEIRQGIEEAIKRIDFWGPFTASRKELLLGPFGAALASRFVADPYETVSEWLTGQRLPPKSITKRQARAFQGLLDHSANA